MASRHASAVAPAAVAFLAVACGGGDGGSPTRPPPDRVAEVTVVPASGVPVEEGFPTIELGESAAFRATARNAQGEMLSTTFVWSTLDPSVATVDADGVAVGRGPGETGIVAEADGVADTATLVVVDSIGPVASVTVAPDRDSVDVGSAVAFEAAAEDADGDLVGSAAFTWLSLDTLVATVDGSGGATGRAPGEAGIVAEAGDGIADTATLVVTDTVEDDPPAGGGNQAPSAEILEPGEGSTFAEGETINFRGEASDPEDGSLPASSLVWRSDRDGELGDGSTVEASLTAGSHVISFTATDSDGAAGADSVSLEVADDPDLVALGLDLLPRGVLASDAARGEAIVTNVGVEAGSYRWSVSEGGTELASGERSGLARGATDTVSVSGIGPLPAGAHDLVLTIDTDDAVAEVDEGNNTAGARLESRPAGFEIELAFVGPVPSQLQDEVRTERDRWQRAITGDLRDVTVDSTDFAQACFGEGGGAPRTEPIDDMLVLVRVATIDSAGGVLAQAGPLSIRLDSSDPEFPPLPLVGCMELDSADVDDLRDSGRLGAVIRHEFGHTLGFAGFMWEFQGGSGDDVGPHQLVEGAGSGDPRFVGPLASRGFRDVGGDAPAVPIETTGGSGTAGSHWRESVFDDELMTGFVDFGSNPLSVVTLGSLGDMFYAVDLGEADPFTLGSGAAVKAEGSDGRELRERVLPPIYGVDLTGRVRRLGNPAPVPPQAAGERR